MGNSEQFCSETIRLKSSSSPFGIHRRVDGTLISVDPFLLSLHPHFFLPRNVAAVGGSIDRRRVGLIPFWIQYFSPYCCGGFSVAPSSRKTLVPTCYCGMDLIMPIMLAYEPQLLRSPLCGRLSGHRFGAPPGPVFFINKEMVCLLAKGV